MTDSRTAQNASQVEGSQRPLSQIAVLHIPHSSRQMPENERQAIRLNDEALNGELLRMTDAYTDELFPVTPAEAGRVVFPISRLICDVERFPSDDNEPMAKRGMGAIYTQTSRDELLRVPPDAARREALLNRWYWPHHVMLARMINDVLERSGICLIVDCHSFSSVALPHELDQTSDRADICVGTDPFHTPSSICDAIATAAKDEGYSVAVDAPFAGALVPLSFYRKDPHVLSVMIEVNRRRYIDENSGAKKQSFEDVRSTLGRLIVSAAQAARNYVPTS